MVFSRNSVSFDALRFCPREKVKILKDFSDFSEVFIDFEVGVLKNFDASLAATRGREEKMRKLRE